MANTTIPIHKLFRVYETLDQFDAEASHPENKICFIKDKRIIYANGVEYTNEQMYNDNITDDIKDAAKFKTVYNALLDELKNRNYMKIKPVPYIYWVGPFNTIQIGATTYKAEPNKTTIGDTEYYQLKLNKDLDNNFYNFNYNPFTNLIFKDVDTNNVTNMGGMFSGCSALTSLDVSKFDTSNVTDMGNMFGYCSALTSLDLTGWNTSNVTNMNSMFSDCSALTSLDVSRWDTSNVTDMGNMFGYCSALKTIRMVGCSQTTIDKIKAQLSANNITGCTIVTE
ncbi:MAG: BspA family leucine-rich repeat surface protein [Lachnospira sp.]|nr:BspA family leucine-rich repeat surface protein [Lachnospira sp.]